MLNSSVRTAFLALILGSSLATAGCSKDKKADKPATEAKANDAVSMPDAKGMKFQPDAAQKKLAHELVKKVDKNAWRFPADEAKKASNAKLFTYLAATNDTPEVVGAALQGMYGTYSSHSKRKQRPDDDFRAAVEKHLKSDNPKLVARALKTARSAMSGKKANKELIGTVVALGSKFPKGPGRYALIEALRVVSAKNRDEKLLALLISSLDAEEPYVQSYALQALYRSTRSIQGADADQIKTKALALAKHADVGVRGRAVELLGALGKDDEAALSTVLAALTDAHPYVRSEAAESLARLRHRDAIPTLVKMLDAKERNRYMLTGWKTLEGKPGRLQHEGSAWGFERDAAMNAIRSLSSGDLKLERIDPKKIESSLDTNVKTTIAWYKATKGKPKPKAK